MSDAKKFFKYLFLNNDLWLPSLSQGIFKCLLSVFVTNTHFPSHWNIDFVHEVQRFIQGGCRSGIKVNRYTK